MAKYTDEEIARTVIQSDGVILSQEGSMVTVSMNGTARPLLLKVPRRRLQMVQRHNDGTTSCTVCCKVSEAILVSGSKYDLRSPIMYTMSEGRWDFFRHYFEDTAEDTAKD